MFQSDHNLLLTFIHAAHIRHDEENILFKGKDTLKQNVLFTNHKFYFLGTMFSQHPTKEYMTPPLNGSNKTANFTFLATCSTKGLYRNVLLKNQYVKS